MGAKTNAILLCLFGVAWTRKDAKIPYYRSLLTLYLFRYSFLVAHVSTSSSIFSSFMQQAHSKDLALRPCCHLGELSHDFYWNLTFSHAKKSLSTFRVGVRKEIMLGPTPMTESNVYTPWILRILSIWPPNKNIYLFIVCQLFLLLRSFNKNFQRWKKWGVGVRHTNPLWTHKFSVRDMNQELHKLLSSRWCLLVQRQCHLVVMGTQWHGD